MRALKYITKTKISLSLSFIIGALLYACKEPYVATIKDNNINYLVIDGFINTGADSTVFSLSRTFKLSGKAVVSFEKGALVQVESDGGATYLLPELAKAGNYGRAALNLDKTKKYRLRVRTKDSREYLSDFVESKTSPPIDEVKFDFKNDELNIYVDAHDPLGMSKYYHYSSTETWEYETQLRSFFIVENHQIKRRTNDQQIFTCWHQALLPNISLASTGNLSEDRVADLRLTSIAKKSPKLDFQYSVLVKQSVLTKQGFDFWETLKKNTQDVGSIFDAQPSQLLSNIRSVNNPSDIVIGFISAGTTSEKRLTIRLKDLRSDFVTAKFVDSVCIKSERSIRFKGGVGNEVAQLLTIPNKPEFIPLDEIWERGIAGLVGYTATDLLYCVDCRTQGGTNKRPSYW